LTDSEIILVAIGPLTRPSEEVVASVARILKKDIYETGLLLAAKIPRVVARLPDMSSAEQVCVGLRAVGAMAFTIPESELNRPPDYFRANKVAFEDGSVKFENRIGKSKSLKAEAIFLLLQGKLLKQTQTETKTTKRKLNITGTLLTGGIPVLKKETKTVKEISTETSIFLRIYGRAAIDPEVDLLQSDIDYSFLGPAMAATSSANFSKLISKIREKFPDALFDNSLMESARPGLSSFTPVDLSAVDSRLTYLYLLHLSA
jgi:hypothetical protein